MKVEHMKGTLLWVVMLSGPVLAGGVHAQDSGFPSRHIAAGTSVKVKLLQNLSSEYANVGDEVRAQVVSGDASGLPAGTVFIGRVTSVHPATPKRPGVVNVQFGTRPLDNNADSPVDMASAHLTGQTPRSDKSSDTTIGAGVGGLLGLSRKRKLGDAITGAALGALGGYAVNQAQKRSASDVSLKKGAEIPLRLDRPLTLRTVIDAY